MALVALNTLATVPTFGTASAERLQRPFEQEELRRWQAVLHGVGVEWSREQLAEHYLAFAGAVAEARAWVLAPLSWWTSLTQTEPGWNLFGTPSARPPALRLSAWSAGQEHVLYESNDPQRDWSGALLGYRRVRASYNPSRSGPPSTYPGLCQRLAERIFAEQPAVERVRCALSRRPVPVPGEEPRHEPEEQHVIDVARAPA